MALTFLQKLNIFGRYKVEQPINVLTTAQYTQRNKKLLKKDFVEWYKTNPFVFWAIQERAKAVSNVKFYFKENGELSQNEITEKLNHPNKYQSQQNFLIQDLTFQSIFGTSYWYVNKLIDSRGFADPTTDILNISADKLIFLNKQGQLYDGDYIAEMIKKDPDQIIVKYIVDEVTREVKELNVAELLPYFDTSTFTNPYFSQSRLESLQYIVSNSQAALEAQNTFLSNPGGIGAWVSRKKDAIGSAMLTERERKEMEQGQQNDYGTLSGQRNIQIIGTDVDYISTIPKVSDLKLNDTLVNAGLTIFGLFGLPKEAFSALASGSTFENQKEAYKAFIESEAQNLIDDRTNSLNKYLGYTDGKIVGTFSHLAVMQEDEERKQRIKKDEISIYSDLLRSNIIDSTEFRGLVSEMIGLEERELVSQSNDSDIKSLLFDASLNLRGTVGGVQGIILVNQSVARGEISRNNAINLLVEIYQYDREIAESLITTAQAPAE